MTEKKIPLAKSAIDIPVQAKASVYPEPFASMMGGREKRRLGDYFGLSNFGVNLTTLKPDAMSALRHSHTRQDEFIYILEGNPSLYSNEGKTILEPGVCAGMRAGSGNATHLVNETDKNVVFLEIGDRTSGDEGIYPDDDLKAAEVKGKWLFTHKDGKPY